jgi:hypothetical protein
VDFTREPVIQSVITPRQGYRLVVRSSKSAGLEEHFVDAVEIVSFGSFSFFRSTERPKPFIVPVSDYEVLEVREPRIVLKTPAQGSIKVSAAEKPRAKQEVEKAETQDETKGRGREKQEARTEKRRDRRRGTRRRRGQARDDNIQQVQDDEKALHEHEHEPFTEFTDSELQAQREELLSTTPMLSSILPPPATLIRDNLERLRQHEAYRDAFYDREKGEDAECGFPEESVEYTESEISMKEGGDVEVPQDDPFRPEDEDRLLSEGVSDAQKNAE